MCSLGDAPPRHDLVQYSTLRVRRPPGRGASGPKYRNDAVKPYQPNKAVDKGVFQRVLAVASCKGEHFSNQECARHGPRRSGVTYRRVVRTRALERTVECPMLCGHEMTHARENALRDRREMTLGARTPCDQALSHLRYTHPKRTQPAAALEQRHALDGHASASHVNRRQARRGHIIPRSQYSLPPTRRAPPRPPNHAATPLMSALGRAPALAPRRSAGAVSATVPRYTRTPERPSRPIAVR